MTQPNGEASSHADFQSDLQNSILLARIVRHLVRLNASLLSEVDQFVANLEMGKSVSLRMDEGEGGERKEGGGWEGKRETKESGSEPPQSKERERKESGSEPPQSKEREMKESGSEPPQSKERETKESGSEPPQSKESKLTATRCWPHAPVHRLTGKGTFIVTASTYQKQHFFHEPNRLDLLLDEFLQGAVQYNWQIEAWAIFSNHYHFVGHALEDAASLQPFLTQLHSITAREINRLDHQSERQVWFNFWETELTFEKSYLARLNYVHQNAVKHGLVPVANQYHWCFAAWFERTASPAQVATIYSFKTDKLNIADDYQFTL